MFQATRRRLAIWYTAVTAILLLLFATGVYLYVRNTLIERVDDTLNHVVEVIERSLVVEPAFASDSKFRINIEATFGDNKNPVEDDRIDLEWFAPNGELLWSTFSEPLNIPIHANREGETVRLLGSENYSNQNSLVRQVTERVEIGRQVVGYLRVSHPWFEVSKPSHELILDLSLGIGAMVICVAAIGWLLSGLAIEPVRESYQRLKQFTSDASHELRSPIAMIQTNVQVALTDADRSDDRHRQQLKVIERVTQRLGRLVDDLLFLARQDSGIVQRSFSPCFLDALLMEVVEEQQVLAREKGIELSLDMVSASPSTSNETEEDLFTIEGDWDRLVRLFTNLIGNALQYTTTGGKVDVELQRITRRNGHPQLQIKVKDTGIGIPEDALPHLFDRFYRVDPARSRSTATGSGLGLAIVAAIVENHHGHIRIDSIVDLGTTITVTLPQYRSETFSH